MNEHDTLSNQNVHGWLMDVPGYRDNSRNERQNLLNISKSDETRHSNSKERPSSLLSISSEDSINLDELINANFTTDMDDETDLPALSSLDLLDDSNEDFWRMDNFLNQLIIPTQHQLASPGTITKQYNSNRSNYELTSSEEDDEFLFDSNNTSLDDLEDSFYTYSSNSTKKETEHDFIKGLSFDRGTKPKLLQVPTSLPVSPKSLTSSSIYQHHQQQRINRSGSLSSENSLNSSTTITQHHIYPTASTSTSSSIGSHSTATTTAKNSILPRSSSTKTAESSQTRISQPRHRPPTSLSESTANTPSLLPSRSISHIGLARRATYIPAPSPPSNKKSIIPAAATDVTPSHTKSTNTLAHKKSISSLTRSASRISQPANSRASHIPAPPTRSITSLGISSIFSASSTSPKQQQQRQQMKDERPKTSMNDRTITSAPATGLRRAPSTMAPSSSRSTSLRMPSSRSMYSK